MLTSGLGKLIQTTSGGAHVHLGYVGPFANFGIWKRQGVMLFG